MPTEVASGVHDITCGEANGKRYRVFLFEGDVPTLFDTGLESTVDAVIEGISEIGVAPERLIITHGDGDHAGGFDALVGEYDLETWVPAQTEADLNADNRYSDGNQIGQFEAIHMPGHKPDNHALVNEEAGVAVMGDALSGADQRGHPAGYFHLPPEVYSTDLSLAERSLEKLLTYDFEVGLVFHGSSVTESASEKLQRYVNFPGR